MILESMMKFGFLSFISTSWLSNTKKIPRSWKIMFQGGDSYKFLYLYVDGTRFPPIVALEAPKEGLFPMKIPNVCFKTENLESSILQRGANQGGAGLSSLHVYCILDLKMPISKWMKYVAFVIFLFNHFVLIVILNSPFYFC